METSRSTKTEPFMCSCVREPVSKMGVYPIQQCEQVVDSLKDFLVSLTTILTSNQLSLAFLIMPSE